MKRSWVGIPGLQANTFVTLSKSLNPSEAPVPHLHNAYNNICFIALLDGINTIMYVKLPTQSVSYKYFTIVSSHPFSSIAIPKDSTVFYTKPLMLCLFFLLPSLLSSFL